ncbi:outer membrane lipoprotein-sorting protein [bacterium]|nr:outer membrane lipoprotein-sorting protein [bacterium]
MIKSFSYFILFVFLCPVVYAQTGLEIIEAQNNSNKGYKTEFIAGTFVTTEKNKSVTERGFEIYREESGKTLLIVTSPDDVKGAKLLSLGQDIQWLYLPSLGKTRRLASGTQNGFFLGTEFTHEDLAPKNTALYDYNLLKNETIGNKDCTVVEAIPARTSSSYSKTISWITTNTYQTLKTEFYAKNNTLLKTAVFEHYARLEGKFWRPLEVTMTETKSGRFTTMRLKSHTIGQTFPESTFKMEALTR